MKKLFMIILMVLICLSVSAGCIQTDQGQSCELVITNSDGSQVTLPGPAKRIALLNSNAGEIFYILGCADSIVGITKTIADNAEQASLYPDAVVIGAWNEPDVEYLISQNVDLVVGYASSKPKNVNVLEATNIPIVYIDCTKPKTMAQDIIEIGRICGRSDEAERIADYYSSVIDTVSERVASLSDRVTVYAESYTEYWGQGTDTGLGQIIELAGGTNIMTDSGARKISDEWVVTSSPEVILKLVNSAGDESATYAAVVGRQGFSTIDAVINDNVRIIRNHLTYGPRSSAAVVAAAKIMYPELFTDMTPEMILTEFNDMFGTQFETGNITYPSL